MLTRRTFLKALIAGAAGLALPPDAAGALVAPARRLWALDGTMLDAGLPNVAKVPLWAEYTVYSDGTVVGPTLADTAAFRQLDRIVAASWRGTITTFEPGIATVVNRSATP